MNRLCFRSEWVAAMVAAIVVGVTPGVAAAQQQTSTMDVVVTGFGNRDANDFRDLRAQAVPVGIQECARNAVLRVRVSGIPRNGQYLSFWRGEAGINCSALENRNNSNIRGCTELRVSDERATILGATMVDLAIPIRELLPCTPNLSTEYNIYFLGALSAEGRGEIAGYDFLPIGMDTQPPAPPNDVKTTNGQNVLDVTWGGTDARSLRELWIYVQPDPSLCGRTTLVDDPAVLGPDTTTDAGMDGDAGTGGDAGTDLDAGTDSDAGIDGDAGTDLDAGTTVDAGVDAGFVLPDAGVPPAPANLEPFATGLGPSTRSYSIDPDRAGIAIGETVAVGVTAVDRAFNIGQISWVCATRVPTRGFCDAVGGCPDRGCSASSPGEDARGAIVAAALGLLGLSLLLRRRRTR